MRFGTWAIKYVTVSSIAYLCDRIINELCLYLCTSSNRGRWAAVIILSCGSVPVRWNLSAGQDEHLLYEKGEIHQVLIWYEMMGQDSVSLISSCVEHMEIMESGVKASAQSVVTEHHTVELSSYYH